MRQLFFTLCLLSTLWSFSQTNPVKKPIVPSELSGWVAKKISADDVATILGTSTQETVTPNETILQYSYDGEIYSLVFDKDRKLSSVSFHASTAVAVLNLSYEKVSALKTANTKEQVIASFGQPTRLAASATEELWFYTSADKDSRKDLMFDFDVANAGKIKRYSYNEEINHETALTSAITTAFHVGASTISDVETLLGKPSKLMMESEGIERWFYRSQNSMLAVFFDKQSKLSDFSFDRREN